MSLIPLVIKSPESPQPTKYIWQNLTTMETFVKSISTPSIGDGEEAGNLGPILSGMPSVFARANMFKNAIDVVSNPDQEGSGLIHFYKTLLDEWRGMISCIALDTDKIEIKRINLTYSDGEPTESTNNIYEPKGSFGNMLFDRKIIWSNPNDTDPKPYIDVILYTKIYGKQIVIGGNNPDSLIFTSAAYNLEGENKSYLKETKDENGVNIGRFIDPVKRDIDPQSLLKVRSYVNHILKNINDFADFFSTNPESAKLISKASYGSLVNNLESWVTEMDVYAKNKGISNKEYENDQIPQVNKFLKPYDIWGNYSTSLIAKDGLILPDDGSVQGGTKFTPRDLLLPNDTQIACVHDNGMKDFLDNKPLLLLKANIVGKPNEVQHFMLPISPKAIKMFGKSLGTVLGLNENNHAVKHRITGSYDSDSYELTVKVLIRDQSTTIDTYFETYETTENDVIGKDMLIWPNFISSKWDKYFLFSEMPHTGTEWQAKPFCVDNISDQQEMLMSVSDPELPEFLASAGKETDPDKAVINIEFNRGVSDASYQYEIYQSKNPFKGFQLSCNNKLAGYAVIDYESSSKAIKSIGDREELSKAHLGVDFGSTNTAIAYRIGDYDAARGFDFKNRRVSLLAPDGDIKNNDEKPAGEDEVFFFQNDEIHSNQIKSVLALHDKNRMRDNGLQPDVNALASEYVKGGFPCFEKNLPIDDSSASSYSLKFRFAKATLIHNMKWNTDESSAKSNDANRKAYLKSLLLQVYSDLFIQNLYPSTLKWAFPSAMSGKLVSTYNNIWQELEGVNPLKGNNYNLEVFTGRNTDVMGKTLGGFGSGTTASTKTDNGDWDDWGDEKDDIVIPDKKEIIIDDNPINFQFEKVELDVAMTESCAVANFIVNKDNFQLSSNALSIVFDIGGSTTDILVLAKMQGKGVEGEQTALVKQSSIRFAAQRVAQATKFSPNFKNVLLKTLKNKNIILEGINNGGTNMYNENTAPYYFEQLVDRLEENEFPDFYRDLGIECQEMVSVNLYVTGLIVFYAGQIARKVKMEIDRSPNKPAAWGEERTEINISFTGKGSRIMDWLKAINKGHDEKYYSEMFVKGFGGVSVAKELNIKRPKFEERNDLSNIKFEVAKGLADPINDRGLYKLKSNHKPLEVIGEEGFSIRTNGVKKIFSSNDSITPELMQGMGNTFMLTPLDSSKPCPRFMEFAFIYFQIATKLFNLQVTEQDFMNGFNNMNIPSYICGLPEYRLAQKESKPNSNNSFDFVAPIIILEGMKFFESVILKKIAGR
jgi:hypothetical protein